MGFVDLRTAPDKSSGSPQVAIHCLQFYVRSILFNFSRPLMFFPTNSLDPQKLTHLVWESIGSLQDCGITVLCIIADGMRTNRKMFEYTCNVEGCSHKFVNVYNPDYNVYLLVDPPHLLKTTRNNITIYFLVGRMELSC